MTRISTPVHFALDAKEAKTRKERRKEARKAKLQRRLHTWKSHQVIKRRKVCTDASVAIGHGTNDEGIFEKGTEEEVSEIIEISPKRLKKCKPQKKAGTGFEQYLEMERSKGNVSAKEDLSLEQKLAKKLKVKKGQLRDISDGLSDLLAGMGSINSHADDDGASLKGQPVPASTMKRKNRLKITPKSSHGPSKEDVHDIEQHIEGNIDIRHKMLEERRVAEKYFPPHLRSGSNSAEHIRVQRQMRGLLNKLSETNVESTTSDVSDAFQVHGRRLVGHIITTEILGACCQGPRGNEQYAAVFAAFVAGITSLVGMDFGANFVASLSLSLEEEYGKKDSLALRNLTLLISFLYTFGVLASNMIFDLLGHLTCRFEELDVATILQLLQTCGVGLRNQDPSCMKEFILTVQQRSIELKATSTDEKTEGINKRVQFMLEAICEIKNNKRRSKDEPSFHIRLKKWLQKLRVEDVQLRSIRWKTLLDPEKKGQWWLLGASNDSDGRHVIDVVNVMDTGAAEADKMLKLAASQRMNTDARRAIFCIIMTGEDYIDAFEKLLRMKLNGKQDREIIRVILECCLQEVTFNKYYVLLTSKLCQHDRNHKFTLQYSLWDLFKQLDSMELRRSANLARMLADLVGSFTLSVGVLKAVDFTNSRSLTSKVIMHFQIFFKILLLENSDEVVWGIFSRIASPPELAALRDGLALFLHQHMLEDSFLQETIESEGQKLVKKEVLLLKKHRLVRKALKNTAGVDLDSGVGSIT